MCHDTDSRPPAPPNPGRVAEHGPLELTATDGTRVAGYRATPAEPNGKRIVLLPDVRGLHPYYEDLVCRFAEAGFRTIAIDYFGRTAEGRERGGTFDWQRHISEVTADHVYADTAGAVESLGGDGPIFTVGFCFGGSHSWRLAASDLPLAGTIGFYGRPSLVNDVVDEMHKPLLLLVAGADQATPLSEFTELAGRLEAGDKDHEMHVYDGAPHSFFDRAYDEWRDACADAWTRILDFTARQA